MIGGINVTNMLIYQKTNRYDMNKIQMIRDVQKIKMKLMRVRLKILLAWTRVQIAVTIEHMMTWSEAK